LAWISGREQEMMDATARVAENKCFFMVLVIFRFGFAKI
jgi:hypothetical protein